MNIALIGLGKIADYHLTGILSAGETIAGGFDINLDNTTKLPQGSRIYTSVEELLQDDKVDTVLLLIPSGDDKFTLSKQILSAGKNLITEKPAVSSIEELEELGLIARQNGSSIHGAFHSRFSPTALFVVDLLSRRGEKIEEVTIWADSPHIIDWQVMGKSSESTSFNAEGPNILSELLLYLSGLSIYEAKVVSYDYALPEVHTQFKAYQGGVTVEGITSWIRGIKQKGVKIRLESGEEIIAIHTDQKVYSIAEGQLFDGLQVDPEITRMQKEYNQMYASLSSENLDNYQLVFDVTSLMQEVMEMRQEIGREQITEYRIK